MPAPVEALQLLALLTRARQELVDRGEFHARKLYDVRPFKCCFAELGYLRRLAHAGRAGGTVVTSMPQLVAGLAAMHPRWDMSGLAFENRDRHHSAVRRRLNALQAMGLLRWRAGVDDDGQERRTEIELREAPDVDAGELAAATRQLERWKTRYGPGLNTGSSTGIRNAAGHGRPLSASERQRRGCEQRKRRGARASVAESQSNSAPPSGTSATPQNNAILDVSDNRDACVRTGARERVTRADALNDSQDLAATDRLSISTTSIEEERSGAQAEQVSVNGAGGSCAATGVPSEVPWDEAALIAKVQARQTQRAPVVAAIAAQATQRAIEVAGWEPERAWPAGRLREAWVVARFGASAAAESGAILAGPLVRETLADELTDFGTMPRPARDDLACLRRAVRRYQDNAQARPQGWPTGGLAALLHLGALASDSAGGDLPRGVHPPRTVGYAIGALDQLSRRMRALATADSGERLDAAAQRARARRQRRPAVGPFEFRKKSTWPAWVACDEHDRPVFDAGGMLQIDAEHPGCLGPGQASYDQVVRDAYLLAGRQTPLEADGRAMMSARHRGDVPPAQRRAEKTQSEWELAELAKRSGLSAQVLERMHKGVRAGVLGRLRSEEADRARAERVALRDRLSGLGDKEQSDG